MAIIKLQKEKPKTVQVTDRDKLILNFIRKFGFCEEPQIRSHFKLSKTTSYRVLGRLVDAGYLIHKNVFFQRHGFYQVSKAVVKRPLNQVPLEIYLHHITVLEVFQRLIETHPNAEVTSERELIAEKCGNGIGKNGHISDGLMMLEDKTIAVEVELSKKSKGRLKKIIEQYLTNSDIDEVWYFCAPEILKRTREMASGIDMIKIINIQEFLNA